MRWVIAGALAAALAWPGAATAQQQKETVASLLKSGFNIVAAVPTKIDAPGLILQKGQEAFMCFVSETPTSKTISTLYCKPVE